MTSLLLRLRGPMQSWGHDSRYQARRTHHVPTKSAVLGLLAAAEGRRRTDPVEDLAGLEFAVRVDQPGTLLRDYQTAVDWRKGPPARLSERFYLQDACFVVAVSGEDQVVHGLADAVRSPHFPLFLGRRSCPVGPDLLVGVVDGGAEAALRSLEWQATPWYRRTRGTEVALQIYRDARPGEAVEERLNDVPVSFDPQKRDYRWRAVHMPDPHVVENPEGLKTPDPFWEAVVSQ